MLSGSQELLWVLPPHRDALVQGQGRAGAQVHTACRDGQGARECIGWWTAPQIRAPGGLMERLFPRKWNFGEGQGTKWVVRDFMEVLRMESAQEGTNIRTATIYPAAINTELLNAITEQDVSEAMTALYARHGIAPDRVANVVAFAIDQPEDTNVNEFTIGPTTQPW